MCAAAVGITSQDSPALAGDATAPSLRELRCTDAPVVGARSGSAARRLQRRYQEIAHSGGAGGLTAIEHNAVALRVAVLNRCHPLAQHYRRHLVRLAADIDTIAAAAGMPAEVPPSRLGAILTFVDAIADGPRGLRQSHVRELTTHGLAIDGIAALARLVACLSYQANLFPEIVPAADADRRETRGE
jgi:uncharacterized protein YciW